jgi:ankyrin repeat protein
MRRKLFSLSVVLASLLLFMTEAMFEPSSLGQVQANNDPPELRAVRLGVPGIDAFVKAGGRFTGQKNSHGQTAAMLAAASTPEVIAAFRKAGGVFTEDKDNDGRSASVYLLELKPHPEPGVVHYRQERAKAVEAFARAGGRISNEFDKKGISPLVMLMNNPVAICAYRRAAAPDDLHVSFSNRQELMAVFNGVTGIQAFVASGGVFSSNGDDARQSDAEMAANRTMTGSKPAQLLAVGGAYDESAGDLAARKGGDVFKAYTQAVNRQGGLEYFSGDDEYTALKNPRSIELFAKAGCQFDDRPKQNGLTAEMIAVMGGPSIVEAFSKYGGKFTNRLYSNGITSGELAAQEDPINAGLLIAYDAAVKRQGGLVLILPKDEYEAATMGATGIEMFARHGGHFTERPNANDQTSAIIAASNGPEAIKAFARAGGHFTDWQNKLGYTAAMAAAYCSAEAITEFAKVGGHFSNQQNHNGVTAAMIVAMPQEDTFPGLAIDLHLAGKQMKGGAVNRGSAAIQAFANIGGRFTDQQDHLGRTAAMYAIFNGPEAIAAYANAGGKFSETEDQTLGSAAFWAVTMGADAITAFSKGGGVFTDRKNKNGLTAERFARDKVAARAYSEAVARQGGLRHVQ